MSFGLAGLVERVAPWIVALAGEASSDGPLIDAPTTVEVMRAANLAKLRPTALDG